MLLGTYLAYDLLFIAIQQIALINKQPMLSKHYHVTFFPLLHATRKGFYFLFLFKDNEVTERKRRQLLGLQLQPLLAHVGQQKT